MCGKCNYKSIGRRIKKVRENMRLTQEELADLIGCSSQHMSVIERGVKLPKLITFINITNALNISPIILLQDCITCTEGDTDTDEIYRLIQLSSKDKKECILKIVKILLENGDM